MRNQTYRQRVLELSRPVIIAHCRTLQGRHCAVCTQGLLDAIRCHARGSAQLGHGGLPLQLLDELCLGGGDARNLLVNVVGDPASTR